MLVAVIRHGGYTTARYSGGGGLGPSRRFSSWEDPMPLSAEGRRLRARAAAATRHHRDQPERYADDRRQLKADAAERYVRELVDTWPPLTDAQRGRLAALLAGGEVDDG
jgi:hypothetical protein